MHRPTEPNATRRHQRGFTVMEMVVSTLVLAILMAIAIPSGEMTDERKLDMLQIQIQDALDYAQDLSYRTGSKHAAIFSIQYQYIAVVNEQVVPMEDPLTRRPYIIRLDFPDQPSGIRIDSAVFDQRPMAPFDEKGVLTVPGTIRISADDSQRWFEINTATAELTEVPITEP